MDIWGNPFVRSNASPHVRHIETGSIEPFPANPCIQLTSRDVKKSLRNDVYDSAGAV